MDRDQILSRIGDYPEYTPKQIAMGFGVNLRTVYRYIESGKLSAFRLFGYRISRESLVSFIDDSLFHV